MTTHQTQPRKLSLVNELSNMDQDYISRRINIELNRIDSNEYQEVLKIFNKKTRNMKDERAKQSYMLSLLDVVNQRKEMDHHGESQHRVYTRNYGCPEELAPSAEPATHHNYRVPPPPPPYSRERSQSENTKNERSEDPAAIVEERPEKNIVRVGDYVILGNLGQGTFGKVKLAEHIVTKEKVAIKVIEKANIKTAKQRVSVQREVRLMRLLNHPHIIKVYDVLYEQDCIMIIMEYASGGELFEYIVQHGRVKEREARLFFRQIISAVDYCHKNSVIHRDLKPENLLLDSNKNLRIIDFGFGNTFHRESLLNTYCGSPFYAAPEMIKGIQYVGPEVDVWSLGVILYALISGRLPFDASSMGELYGKIAKGVYDVPDHFSDGAAHLISRMITLDPTDRATIQEVRQSAWVNVEHERLPESFLPSRPSFVLAPNDQSLMQLVSFGFDEGDARRALRRRDLGPHPITSLYHLLEETRSRIEQLELGDASTINKNLKAKETLRRNSDPPREAPLVSLKDEPIYRSDPSNIATVPTDPRDKAVGAAAPKHQTPIKAISKLTRPRIRVGNNCELHTMELTAIKPFENNRPQNPPSSTPNWPKPVANSTLGHESTATETDLFIRTPKSSAGYRPGITCNKPRTVYTKKMSLPTENGNQPNGPTRCAFTDNKEFRVVRAFFNASTTSFRPVAQIIAEVERVLNANEISYTYNPGTHVFSCKYFEEEEYKKEVMWDIEVCRIDRLTGHCLQLRRVQGNLWSYKRLAKRLIDGFSL